MRYEEIEDVLLIKLPIEINVEDTKHFSNTLEFFIQKGIKKFVLDFSDTKFVSSAFISILVSTKKRLGSLEGGLALVNVNQSVYRIFEITGLLSFFDIFSFLEEALEYLGTNVK